MYQARLALLQLLQLPEDTAIFLEKDDDLDLIDGNGRKSLASLKHKAIGDKLTDLSTDFWKSVYIWLTRYKRDGRATSNLRFFLLTTSMVSSGSFLTRLLSDPPAASGDVTMLTELAEAALDASTSKLIAPIAAAFNELSDLEKQDFLERIVNLDGSPRIVDVPALIRDKHMRSIRREHREYVFERLEGWWTDVVIRQLSDATSEGIFGHEVSDKLSSFAEEYKADNLLITFRGKMPTNEIDTDADPRLAELTREVDGIAGIIKQKEAELSSAISANEIIAQMGTRNNAAARAVGRISLFLETLLPSENLATLEAENRRLHNKVKQLEDQIGTDDSNERLTSILNNISAQVSQYIQKFNAEFAPFPARLSQSQLTIIFDRPERPVPMSRTGGGENHLAYHLSALLALHLFAARNNRPIPRFLLIDQPTQVYFPSEKIYRDADGSVQNTEKDADLDAVRRLFELLLKFTQEDVPGFQLIVTEHANLREQWFQDALIEKPWTKPPALVPADWKDR